MALNDSFFSGVSGLSKIPVQNLVRITQGDTSVTCTPSGVEVPLIYDDESVSIKAKSNFDNLADPSSNPLMTLISGASGGILPSGQFALQSVQIWKSTDPLELSFNVKVYMKDSGFEDVVYPVKKLMKLCLPYIPSDGLGEKLGNLVPPGPTLKTLIDLTHFEGLSLLAEKVGATSGGLVNVEIGVFHFNNCILTEVAPEFSTTVDEEGYPISADISIELRTCMVATTGMIESMTSRRE